MQIQKTQVPLDNPVVFIADPTGPYGIPPNLGEVPVAAIDSCIAVETIAPCDGEITLVLGPRLANPRGRLAFEGDLQTPGHVVAVIGADTRSILSLRVPSETAHVRVWTNERVQPDVIEIEAR